MIKTFNEIREFQTSLCAQSPVLKKVWCEYEYEYGLGVSMVWGVVFPGP